LTNICIYCFEPTYKELKRDIVDIYLYDATAVLSLPIRN